MSGLADGGVIDGTVTATQTTKPKSLAERIREQMNPEPPKAPPPNKRRKPTSKK